MPSAGRAADPRYGGTLCADRLAVLLLLTDDEEDRDEGDEQEDENPLIPFHVDWSFSLERGHHALARGGTGRV